MSMKDNNSGASFPPINTGPSWNVPRVSLPGLFGMQPQFGMEWWYYVGILYNTGGKPFSVQLQILRAGSGLFQVGYGITGIGWCDEQGSRYISGQGFGLGAAESALTLPSVLIPPVGDHAYSASLVPLLELVNRSPDLLKDFHLNLPMPDGWDGWKFEYLPDKSTGHPVGAAGSYYALNAHGRGYQTSADSAQISEAEYRISLTVEDKRGTVMEGISGYVGPQMFSPENKDAPASYECAQPHLEIRKGGSLIINGEKHGIERGCLWLDRQMLDIQPLRRTKNEKRRFRVIGGLFNRRFRAIWGLLRRFVRYKDTQPSPPTQPASMPTNAEALKTYLVKHAPKLKALYRGDWMGFVLDEGTVIVLAEFWQKSTPQWITGTKTGKPPQNGFGNLYFNSDGDTPPMNGGLGLRPRKSLQSDDWDFDVNILDPETPAHSPHWTSLISGKTYATAWQIDFSPRLAQFGLPPTLYVYAVSDNCEIISLNKEDAFFEGAAMVYSDKEKTEPVGHVFVEQMGFD